MPVRLVSSQNYNNDREKILDEIIDYALRTSSNAVPILQFFRREEKSLLRKIKKGPLNAGVDFPAPVKKGTTHSGHYIILYTYLPFSASTNSEVARVNLDSIFPTASKHFNEMTIDFNQVDFSD